MRVKEQDVFYPQDNYTLISLLLTTIRILFKTGITTFETYAKDIGFCV